MSRSRISSSLKGSMKEVARVLPSKMGNFILIKALSKSETRFVI
ncbi:MAG: hypothetical protein Q8O41_02055 [Candidatus Methanoperedens sp.]|nr:hypothetical protein [Candidatus Methanoperedens sp.]